MVKNLPAIQEIQVQSLGQEDPLETGTLHPHDLCQICLAVNMFLVTCFRRNLPVVQVSSDACQKHKFQAFLVLQWLRICLQSHVRPLAQEDSTCLWTAKTLAYNY